MICFRLTARAFLELTLKLFPILIDISGENIMKEYRESMAF